ncbi:MAG: hypothetical protein ACI3XI_07835 [Eubacteriales bacterium]
MKKILSILLMLALLCGSFAACTGEGTGTEAAAGATLEEAAAYLKTMYKDLAAAPTAAAYTLVPQVMIGDDTFTIKWTVNNDQIVITEGATAVSVAVPSDNVDAIDYELTGTLTDAKGETTTVVFKLQVPASNLTSIPDALLLEDGTFVTVKGTVVLVNTAWSDSYGNISVTIEDEAGNQLYLYRLATKVELGDVVTVKGDMATYNGARQIAAGATAEITGHVEIKNEYPEYSIPDAIKLDDNTLVTVKGTVVSIDTPWSDTYNNITVTIEDDAGNQLYIYRLATKVELGDILTIKGIVGSYNGAKQIAAGATAEITGHKDVNLEYPEKTLAEALAAEDGTLVTVKGTVVEINTAWSDSYGNITVTIADAAGTKLYVYRLATKVELGDIVTIKGKVGSYNGAKQIAAGATAEITGKDNTVGDNTTTGGDNPTTPVNGLYDFSKITDSVQYAQNEVHQLDDVLKVTTNDAHFNTQLRLYHSAPNDYAPNGRHATAVFESTKVFKSLSVNAGNKDDVLKVSASVDGTNWVVVGEITVTSAYADYTVNIDAAAGYKFIKLEPTEAQIRVASITVEYAD